MKALAGRGDVPALVAAVGYHELIQAPDGGAFDRGVTVRREAILALGAIGPDAGAEAVTAALSDPSDHVRVAAIQVLYARHHTTPLAAALAWLPKTHGHARQLAIRALAELRQPDSAPALAAALVLARGEDPVDEEEATLLTLLLDADEGSDIAAEVVEQLLVALADEGVAVSDRAEDLLTIIAPTSVEGLIAELRAGAAPDRAAATLARIKDRRALEPLMESVLHRDARVRAESATALGELRDPAAVEALIHATRDTDHEVRARAGSALDQLGMVALMVGVSTLVRPMLLKAIADETRPAIPEQATGDANPSGPAEAAESANGSGAGKVPGPTPGSAAHPPNEPPTADLLERLFAAPDDDGTEAQPRS